MTLNGVTALILRYFIKLDSTGGRLRQSGWRQTYNVRKIAGQLHFAKIDPRSSRTASLRQLSFLLSQLAMHCHLRRPFLSVVFGFNPALSYQISGKKSDNGRINYSDLTTSNMDTSCHHGWDHK